MMSISGDQTDREEMQDPVVTEDAQRSGQVEQLIEIAKVIELFRTPDGVGYADITVEGHRETYPVRGRGFERWLRRRAYERFTCAPSKHAIAQAVALVDARASFGDVPERQPAVRVARHGDALYLDLADQDWRAVEITSSGWKIVVSPPVRFIRPIGMRPLPEPVAGGSIEQLHAFLNLNEEYDFTLVVGWLLCVLRDRGPYPVLVMTGPQGSAKSTCSNLLRALLDPSKAALRSLPRQEQDMQLAAQHSRILAFDNISGLKPETSDILCRMATGAGFGKRELYTDHDEVLYEAARPIMLNGIGDIVERADLADRSIILSLAPIPDADRRPAADLDREFQNMAPKILGALLNGVCEGLKNLPDIHLRQAPRMADAAAWVTACETAYWTRGVFLSAYDKNRSEVIDTMIESDTVACLILGMLEKKRERRWTGTATALLCDLAVVGRGMPDLPRSPNALSSRLQRLEPCFERAGIRYSRDRARDRNRTRITKLELIETVLPDAAPLSSTSSRSSESELPRVVDAPTICELDDAADLDDRWLDEKAARDDL